MPQIQPPIATVANVISALGGARVVMDLTEAQSSQVVTNWLSRNRFAHSTFLILTAALEKKGLTADPNLWGIVPATTEDDCPVP